MVIYKKYGEVFKKLRKQRGFKLTSFNDVGVSAASLCKFERGLSLLKFDKLLLVLSKLSVTLGEYEKCLNNYDLDRHEVLIQNIIISLVSKNTDSLLTFHKEAIDLQENYLALAIKAKYTKLNFEEREELRNFFEEIFFWRYTDLYTLYLSLDLLESSEILFILENIFISNTEVFNSLEHRTRVTHVICRSTMILISKGRSKEAQYLLSYMQYEDYKHTMFTKNLVNFVMGFWEKQFGEKNKGEVLMRKALNTFDSLSYPEISDYYRKLYEKYSR